MDKDQSNELDLDEFYRHFKLTRTPFADRVFSIMDENGSGEIDFREFVCCIWNYCSYDMRSLVKFAFSLMDLDGGGALDKSEVLNLIKQVYGDNSEGSSRVTRVMQLIDGDGDGTVSFEEFVEFNRKYPVMLFPAFKMQQTLREKVFGFDFWEEQMLRRRKMEGARSTSIFEILSKMDDPMYREQVGKVLENSFKTPKDREEAAKYLLAEDKTNPEGYIKLEETQTAIQHMSATKVIQNTWMQNRALPTNATYTPKSTELLDKDEKDMVMPYTDDDRLAAMGKERDDEPEKEKKLSAKERRRLLAQQSAVTSASPYKQREDIDMLTKEKSEAKKRLDREKQVRQH
jgi:Ca2+-binding EF-hand superfamily protein